MGSGIIKHEFDAATLVAEDGTAVTPLTCTCRFLNGDVSLSGLVPGLRQAVAYEGREGLRSLRKAGRAYPTITFTADMAEFTEADSGTFLEFVMRVGQFAAAVSTGAAIGDLYVVDMTFTLEGTDLGDEADHELVVRRVHVSADWAEGGPDRFTFSGVIYGDVELDGEVITAPSAA